MGLYCVKFDTTAPSPNEVLILTFLLCSLTFLLYKVVENFYQFDRYKMPLFKRNYHFMKKLLPGNNPVFSLKEQSILPHLSVMYAIHQRVGVWLHLYF